MTHRPVDWTPLRSADPVPGDPEVVEAESLRFRDVAGELRAQVVRLRRIATDDVLVGEFADAVRTASADLVGDLQQVERRFDEVAAATGAWAGTLRTAQDRADAALRRAQEAEAEARRHRVATPLPPAPTPEQLLEERRRVSMLEAAEDEVRRAERVLDGVEADHDADAAATARRLRAATDDGLADSRWDDVRGTASAVWRSVDGLVTRYAGVLKRVAEVLGHLALAFAVLALCLTGAGAFAVLALLATAGALAARLALATTGNGSWLDVGLEAFALLTFGTGRIATRGLQAAHAGASATVRATARASRAATSARRAQLGRQLARHPRAATSRAARVELDRLQAEAARLRRLERPRRPEALSPRPVAVLKAGGELLNAQLVQDLVTMTRAVPALGSPGAGWLRLARASYGAGIAADLGDTAVGSSELVPGKPALGSWEQLKDRTTTR